ncbi:MAG: VCBS repeat-containing protein [Planctomycetia bacterium]|nr:VCBS repeat-containing protein [Planctomycetia bacterium]
MAGADAMRGRAAAGLAVGGVAGLAALAAIVVFARRGGEPAAEELLPRPAEYVKDVDQSESVYEVANGSVKKGFVKGVKELDWGKAAGGLAAGFRGTIPAPKSGKAVPDGWMGVREYGPEGLAPLDAQGFLGVLKEHLADWEAVERTTWRPYEFLLDPGGKTAVMGLHFGLGGRRAGGLRSDIAADLRARAVTEDGSLWRLDRVEWVRGTRLDATRTPWVDVTDEAGLHFNESDANRALRQSMIEDRAVTNSGSLVVTDWNRDGRPDVLASVVGGELVAFLNDGNGGFTRQMPLGLKPDEVARTYLAVDLDGDGLEELVGGTVRTDRGGKAAIPIYTRRGGAWETRWIAFDTPVGLRGVIVQALVPADFDRDGDIDFCVCNYSDADSKQQLFNRIVAYDGADNYLFVNQGGLNFTEESDARGITGTQYTYVAKWWDFDFDGDLDLFEGNDYGPNHLWLNDGKGRFTDAKDHIFDADTNYSMGVTVADWENDGTWGMYISNMYSHAGNRVLLLSDRISPEMRRLGFLLAQGNQFYERNSSTGEWRETSVSRMVNWADWSWACLFFDVENDGDRDLFVANGYTTSTDPTAPDY